MYTKHVDPKSDDIVKGIKDAFLKLTQMLAKGDINCDFSGSTCVTSLIINNSVFTANVGDSRAIMCRKIKDKWIAVPLSYD